MARIRFLSTQIYQTGAPGKGPQFPAGFVLDSSDVPALLRVDNPSDDFACSFLRRWVNRNVAEYVGEDVEPSDVGGVVYIDPGKPASVGQPFGTARHGRPIAGTAAAGSAGGSSGDGADGKQPEPKQDLSKLTREELDKRAAALGIDITGANNKGDVIALLEAAAKPAE
jgi:hypothetical protein